MERPSGTVSFLFTDIEGSTRLWDTEPVAMGAALARHDEILRSAIDRHGGQVFATGGDGFAAAFTGPATLWPRPATPSGRWLPNRGRR